MRKGPPTRPAHLRKKTAAGLCIFLFLIGVTAIAGVLGYHALLTPA